MCDMLDMCTLDLGREIGGGFTVGFMIGDVDMVDLDGVVGMRNTPRGRGVVGGIDI
jgi:hypothetical protein